MTKSTLPSGNIAKVVLAASVSINLLLVGYVMGQGLYGAGERAETSDERRHGRKRMKRPTAGGPAPMAFSARALGQALPEEAREKARAVMADKRPELRDAMRAVRRNERNLRDLLSAETLDLDAVTAAFDAHRDHMIALQSAPKDVLLAILPSLSLEERQHLAKKMFDRKRQMRRQIGDHMRKRMREERDSLDEDVPS